jgi:hypothetical protein
VRIFALHGLFLFSFLCPGGIGWTWKLPMFDNIGSQKVDFSIKRIGADNTLDQAACEDGLRKEINGCDNGGRTAYTNWEYT